MNSSATSSARRCPACGHAAGRNLFGLPVTFNGALSVPEYRLSRCTRCDTLYVDPNPPMRDLAVIYGTTQFASEEYTNPETISAIVRYLGGALSAMVNARGWNGDFSVIEIGAGRAWMCLAARLAYPASRTVAQDVTAECSETAPWADDYRVVGLETAERQADEKFELISLTHVIEHLGNPLDMLRRLAKQLKPDGIIFLTAPYRPVGFDAQRPDRTLWEQWSYNHVPAHIQYFSRTGLDSLARRCGLNLERWDDRHDAGQAFEAWLTPA